MNKNLFDISIASKGQKTTVCIVLDGNICEICITEISSIFSSSNYASSVLTVVKMKCTVCVEIFLLILKCNMAVKKHNSLKKNIS